MCTSWQGFPCHALDICASLVESDENYYRQLNAFCVRLQQRAADCKIDGVTDYMKSSVLVCTANTVDCMMVVFILS